jgi:hypothetical protein
VLLTVDAVEVVVVELATLCWDPRENPPDA